MRLPNQSAQRKPLRFNLTPLIDVVFLLIIFFLVASHFVRNEVREEVALPTAELGDRDLEAAANRLTVTVRQDGKLFIGGEPQSEQSISRQITELSTQAAAASAIPEVRIRSDRDAAYVHVRKLIERCAASNVRSIRFAVTQDL